MQGLTFTRVAHNVVRDLRNDAYDKLQDSNLNYFDTTPSGDLVSAFSNDSELVGNMILQGYPKIIQTVVTFVLAFTLLFIIAWQIALAVLLLVPIGYLLIKKLTGLAAPRFGKRQRSLGLVNSTLEESINGHDTIKLYGLEEEMYNKFLESNNELRDATFKANLYSFAVFPSIGFLSTIVQITTLSIGALLNIKHKAISIGQITAALQYANMLVQPLRELGQISNVLQSGIAGAVRVVDILDLPSEYKEKENITSAIEGEVVFENVDFSYNPTTKILTDVSFVSKKGTMTAIVGKTGGGKTTIVNLINRFYDRDSGLITVDGIDINSYDKDYLRRNIGVVLQDTVLFSTTILDNLTYGCGDIKLDKVIEVCKQTGADAFISKLRDGYNTEVISSGKGFSKGERQLISVTRTLLADPNILILDEATSNVDTKTEKHIQESVEMLLSGRTSFVIAHRLQTIRKADNIIVLDQGVIIEQGNHDELVKLGGHYAGLCSKQKSG